MANVPIGALTSGLLKITVAGSPASATPATATPNTDYQVAGTPTAPTATELGYVSGVTQSIQAQLNAKSTSSLDTSLATTEYSGTTRTLGVSGTVNVGDFCMYVNSAGTPLFGRFDHTDVTKKVIGVCVGSSGSNRTVLLSGRFRHDTVFSGLTTAGVTVWRNTGTDGGFQVTTPTGANNALQVLGITEGTQTVLINPSMDVFTIA